jgi:hypothetical protein
MTWQAYFARPYLLGFKLKGRLLAVTDGAHGLQLLLGLKLKGLLLLLPVTGAHGLHLLLRRFKLKGCQSREVQRKSVSVT